MRVLVLAWGVDADAVPASAHGLARALAVADHDVVLVTRLAPDADPPVIDGVEVHAVTDAPPIVPAQMDDPLLRALAFAGRATSVAVRRIEERGVDVVHAEGWQAGPVVTALRHSHDVPVVAVVEPWDLEGEGPVADTALAVAEVADVTMCRAPAGDEGSGLPVGVALPPRRPGPPPARGPLHLAVRSGDDHRVIATAIRERLAVARRISGTWTRRPFAAVVLDPQDLRTVAQAWATGIPVVTVDGPTGELVRTTGSGVVVADDPGAVAAAVDGFAGDRGHAAELGAAAVAAAGRHDWAATVEVWEAAAAAARERAGGRRLHAAG